MPVYVDITLVTDIYLNTIQIIEFGKSIVPHTADVNYTVCNSDVYIIGTVVYVTDPRRSFLFKHNVEIMVCGISCTVNGIIAFGVKLWHYIGIIMGNRMDGPFIVGLDIHIQRSDLPVDSERGVVRYTDSHSMWPRLRAVADKRQCFPHIRQTVGSDAALWHV